MKSGKISSMNKTVKTDNIVADGALIGNDTGGKDGSGTLLADIDTTGMSKLQKKKLRKKLAKERNEKTAASVFDEQDDDDDN